MAEYIEREKLLDELGESASYHANNSREECLLYRDRNIVREQPTADVIPISEGATNGDMIKAMFPNAQIDYHEKSDLVDDYVTVFIKGCDTCQDYSYDWWNALYMKEVKHD